jgi:hypothetical protein
MPIKDLHGNDLTVRDVIIALRGGIPEKCDFCGKQTPPEQMHPEEAGEWACETCLKRDGKRT